MHLFLHEALARQAHVTKNEPPKDLWRDFAVVEEYRVGALEVVRSFGRSLVSRPAHFLRYHRGKRFGQAARGALLSARAEISVYPERLQASW